MPRAGRAPSHAHRRRHERRHAKADHAAAPTTTQQQVPSTTATAPPQPPPAPPQPAPAAQPAPAPPAGHLRWLMSAVYGLGAMEAIGTTAVVVVEAPAVDEAERLLAAELDAIDRTCSRFRPDSELMRANDAAGRPTPISALFAEAVHVALRAAQQTDGAVDPTVAPALVALGYDRDFAAMQRRRVARRARDTGGGLAQRDAGRRAPAAADGPRMPPRSRRDGQGPGRGPCGRGPSPRPPARRRSSISAETWPPPVPPRPAAGWCA